MLIENEFTVEACPQDVFALMVDVERVAPCIPGTQVTGRRDDGAFDGEMSLRLGPMKMRYRGTVAITSKNEATHEATMLAKGTEAQGQGTAQGTMNMAVRDREDGGSDVTVATDIKLTGRVAQMGQGIMKDVSTKMIAEMAQNMAALLDSRAAQPPDTHDPGLPNAGGSSSGARDAQRDPDGVADRPPAEPVSGIAAPPAARIGGVRSSVATNPAPAQLKVSSLIGAVVKGRLTAAFAWLRMRVATFATSRK